MQPTLNVLLTGASGTVGFEVLRQLVDKNTINLTVFDQKTTQSTRLFAPYKNKITIIYGDLCNENQVRKIPANMDVAIHLAAVIPPLADENPQLTYKVNVTGTKSVLEVLQRTSPNVFLLYSSSIAVYGDRVFTPIITLNDPLNPSDRDFYGRTKIEAEELIKNSKLNWSIFRLAAIMKNHKISKLMFHMPLNTQLEICTPKDAARAFVEAISHQKILNRRIYNLGGGESCRISYQLFLEKSFSLFGLGKLNFPVNTFAQRNFHCGIFKDGDILEEILHFRTDSLNSYFNDTKKSISLFTKLAVRILRVFIKRSLLNQSEPFKAVKENNQEQLSHFFLKKEFPLIS